MSPTATLAPPLGRLLFTIRLLVQGNPALGPGLLATIGFVAMAGSEAGFYPSFWYAIALLTLALLVATVVAVGVPREVPRPILAGVLLMGAFAAWQYASISWAGENGQALDGANRTLFYTCVLMLFAFWPWNPRGARLVLGTFGLGIAGIALSALLRFNADPLPYLSDGRLVEPAGYINANVAMWVLGTFPCLYLASTREVAPPTRGLFLGCAGLLSCVTLLGQSRGWLVSIPVAVLVFVLCSRHWRRALATVLAVAAATAVLAPTLLSIRDDFDEATIADQASEATTVTLIVVALLVLAGTLTGIVERRFKLPSDSTRRRSERALGVVLVTIVLLASAGVVTATGNPYTRLSDSWAQFKRLDNEAAKGQSRFLTGGTNRYDFWVVAWDVFGEHPVRGVGADGFQPYYLRRGKSLERPRYAHSLELGVLAQTGLVGALLVFGAMAALAAVAFRAIRKGYAPVGAAAGAAAAVFTYWFLHGSVDWFWEFAGLGAPALAMLGLAAGLAPRGRSPLPPPARPLASLPIPALAAGAAAVAATTVLLAGPWISDLEVDRAADQWRGSPEAAFTRLDRARQLNPLSAQPDLAAGTIALRLGRLDQAETAFSRARRREPQNAYALLELGLIAAERDDRARATALLRRVTVLHPRDEVPAQVLRDVRAGRYVTTARVNELLLRRAQGD